MTEQKTEFRTRDRLLMFAFAVGPLAALAHLNVSYALVPQACADQSKAMLHVATVIFVAIALSGAVIGWRRQRAFAGEADALWKERTHWLAVVVTVLSIFSAVVIVAMELVNVILRSCD